MSTSSPRRRRSWPVKFRDAFRGLGIALRGSSSFVVHLTAAGAVIAAGVLFRVDPLAWCILCACIALVLAAETFNSALESLARAISDQYHPRLRDALDMGSGAVLLTAIGAAVIGAIVFLNRLAELAGWW
ncbi:MAG: diacylglycerol kinase family protein [Thermoguttaceae bacterium]